MQCSSQGTIVLKWTGVLIFFFSLNPFSFLIYRNVWVIE